MFMISGLEDTGDLRLCGMHVSVTQSEAFTAPLLAYMHYNAATKRG